MRKINSQKGITLIALIITIVVLLILAVVTIGAVQEDGIIGKAKYARDEYKKAQDKENSILQGYLSQIEGSMSGNSAGNTTESDLGESNNNSGDNQVENDSSSGNTNQGGDTEQDDNNAFVGNLGKYVRYDVDGDGVIEDNDYESILWRVLRDDSDKVELITADALGTVALISTDYDEGRSNYNGAVSAIVQECVRVTGIASVRSVGGPNTEEPLSDNNTVDFSELEGFSPTVSIDIFNRYEGAENGLRKEDNNYEEDYNQMEKAGVVQADNYCEYWVASRSMSIQEDWGVNFSVRCVWGDGSYKYGMMCFVTHDGWGDNEDGNRSYAVRPVLTLEAGILDEVTGAGTKEQPIEIY